MDKQFQGKGEKSNIHNLWESIVSELSKTREIPTVRRRTTEAVWFSAHSINGNVIIDKSQIKKPSSKLNGERKIDEKEFSKIYPYYQRWRKGEILRKSIQKISLNTSYILALINHFEKNNYAGSI